MISPKISEVCQPWQVSPPRLLRGHWFRLGEGRHLDASRLRMRTAEISNFK